MFTIGEIAARSGFSASALRYYEKHGLLEPVTRTDAGYRLYDDGSLARLGFVARAKELGCTLDEIVELAELWEDDDCGPVQARLHELVTAKIADARRRRAELDRFEAQLRVAADHLGGDPVDGRCDAGCACMGTEAPEPSTCTLPAGEVPGRIDEWSRVLSHVAGREPVEGGVRLLFEPEVELGELVQLARAELGCCSFFAFALTVDDRGTALEVRAPAGARDVLDAVFGAPA